MKTVRFPVYGAGDIYRQDSLTDRRGSRVARRFLDRLFVGFAKHCSEFHRHTGDQLFAYGERQIHTVVLSSILGISRVALAELQVKRKPWGREKTWGPVDYWVRAWESVFFIELKHTFHAAMSKRFSAYTRGQWEDLVSQVKSLRVDQVREESLSYSSDNLFVIGLFIVPTYVGRAQQSRILKFSSRKSQDIVGENRSVGRSIGLPKPNWHGCWVVPENMRMTEYDNRFEILDGVNCFAYVRQVLR